MKQSRKNLIFLNNIYTIYKNLSNSNTPYTYFISQSSREGRKIIFSTDINNGRYAVIHAKLFPMFCATRFRHQEAEIRFMKNRKKIKEKNGLEPGRK